MTFSALQITLFEVPVVAVLELEKVHGGSAIKVPKGLLVYMETLLTEQPLQTLTRLLQLLLQTFQPNQCLQTLNLALKSLSETLQSRQSLRTPK